MLAASRDDYTVSQLSFDVSRFWPALTDAVQLFGGSGDSHLALRLNADYTWLSRRNPEKRPRTDVRRWTQAARPSDNEIANVTREIERAFGRTRWEPDAD